MLWWHRRDIEATLGLSTVPNYPLVQDWLLGRALEVYWQVTDGSEPPEDLDERIAHLSVTQAAFCGATHSRCLTKGNLLRRDLAINTGNGYFCNNPFCPSCSVYKFFHLLRMVLICPPGFLMDRRLGYLSAGLQYPDEALRDWTVRAPTLEPLGWVNLGDYTVIGRQEMSFVQARWGYWWSPRDVFTGHPVPVRGLAPSPHRHYQQDDGTDLELYSGQDPVRNVPEKLDLIERMCDPEQGWHPPAGSTNYRDSRWRSIDQFLEAARSTETGKKKQICLNF